MSNIPSDKIEAVKRIDLLTYLQKSEPDELVEIGSGVYTTKTHDSLKISNGKWMWWSQSCGGRSALDYLIKVRGMTFLEAVRTLSDADITAPAPLAMPTVREEKHLKLPPKCPSTSYVRAYLRRRCIDNDIVDDCIARGLIYESMPYHNVVFIGCDSGGKARYASFRATVDARIMGDCPGSDKRYSFRLGDGKSGEVHLFESAIDLLSYATVEKQKGTDCKSLDLLSLGGVYAPKKNIAASTVPEALRGYLEEHGDTRRIVLHLDNDEAGRGASRAIKTILSERYEVVDSPPPYGKDYNDFLRSICSDKELRAVGRER